MKRKILVVGGVAGGATAAARLRRLDEMAEIVLLERGEYISYANCGLPYYVGGVISQRQALFVSDKARFEARYAIDVRDRSEATVIDRANKRVTVKNLRDGTVYHERYDELILATGSSPLIPDLPGIDGSRVQTFWTVADTDELYERVRLTETRRVAVVGAGFVGLELTENLLARGLEVVLIEKLPQVLAPLDADMARMLETELRSHGVELRLGTGLSAITEDGRRLLLNDGGAVDCDFVVLSLGVRPNSQLARDCGLTLNARGGIVVDDTLRSSDPSIFAIGDVAEVRDFNTGGRTMLPLAGPANRQARIAADNIIRESQTVYTGAQGSSVIKIFGLTAACTGLNEKTLGKMGKRYRRDYLAAILHPSAHAAYYPGGAPISLKVLFDLEGELLGAQAIGKDGVDKRVDVLATALRFSATVYDLQNLELAYAPPFSSAKDPVNLAGYAAADQLERLSDAALVRELPELNEDDQLLDVREAAETSGGTIDGAICVPLSQLRRRMPELDKNKRYIAYCATGLRSYVAERQLKSRGYRAANLLGAYRSYSIEKQPLEKDQADKHPGRSL